MRFEYRLIADELRVAFDRHIDRIGKDPAFAGKSERNLGIGLDISNGSGLLEREIVRCTVYSTSPLLLIGLLAIWPPSVCVDRIAMSIPAIRFEISSIDLWCMDVDPRL